MFLHDGTFLENIFGTGIGAYGDVLTVYDDDGVEFAIKLFEPSDCREEGDEVSDEESFDGTQEVMVLDLGTLREISILRLLRHENSHKNVIQIHDLKQSDSVLDDHNNGGDLMSNIGLVMPLYSHGNLSDAINSGIFTNKRMKVRIAHGILNAVAYLHLNGIIHRDIKGDNVMLQIDESTGDFFPILIDFSLAKIIEPQIFHTESDKESTLQANPFLTDIEFESTHTPDTGTATYKAPEVLNEQPYSLPADMYSVGVVLLELLLGKTLEATKDKDAIKFITETIQKLPDQPFANMIKGLLETDPHRRLSAADALKNEVFLKFEVKDNEEETGASKLEVSPTLINLKESLPLDEIDCEDNGCENNPTNINSRKNASKKQSKLKKRLKLIQKIAHVLESKNPFTIHAAMTYAGQLSQLENCDDIADSQALFDCVVLAHKFFENEIWNLYQVEQLDEGIFKDYEWSVETYKDNEEAIFVMMDFCLYPRELLDIGSF